ncbi:hypothetical protein BU16DRAFT_544886 [Lophium mytilinum]|uniref:Uncharacterized protein n=1 Tax=Lophium mytilinum TaxID=390894 RepID=A0A6A6QCW9_9PEZI|nr:hypothetical protein BU16DRAFT_544886 [Lophium mytilinum]
MRPSDAALRRPFDSVKQVHKSWTGLGFAAVLAVEFNFRSGDFAHGECCSGMNTMIVSSTVFTDIGPAMKIEFTGSAPEPYSLRVGARISRPAAASIVAAGVTRRRESRIYNRTVCSYIYFREEFGEVLDLKPILGAFGEAMFEENIDEATTKDTRFFDGKAQKLYYSRTVQIDIILTTNDCVEARTVG